MLNEFIRQLSLLVPWHESQRTGNAGEARSGLLMRCGLANIRGWFARGCTVD